jgi:cation transport protein ChaC
VTDVYLEALRPVTLLDGSGRIFRALCYLVDRNHEQYAGKLSIAEQIAIIRAGKGQAGGNIEYVLRTFQHLEDAGVHDPLLSELVVALKGKTET